MTDDPEDEHEVVCSRDMAAFGAPELMSVLCRGEAETAAMADLFDRLADESVAPTLAAGQTVAHEGAVYLLMEPVDSAARSALGAVYALASGATLSRDARLLLVERLERAAAEGIPTPDADPDDPGSVTLAL